MPTYRYTGEEPRTPAPPLQGDLIPGGTVESAEPVEHPDLELVEGDAAPQPVEAAPQPVEAEALPVEDAPRRRSARSSLPKE